MSEARAGEARAGEASPAEPAETGMVTLSLERGVQAVLSPAALPARVPPQTKALPGLILERYEAVALLGRGGMGEVYRARDRRLDRDVALKLLVEHSVDPEPSLLREARSQARLDHEHACRVYDVGVADGQAYLVMQLIDGETFGKVKEHMTLEEKVTVVRQVALALHQAHRFGLVHRDVKPSNIMVEHGENGAWKPYLMDFGIAREIGVRGKTLTGAVAGTPAFMAPEQAGGELRSLDRRTDVYSLGATLYDVLAGRPPFTAPNAWQLLRQIMAEDAPPIRSVNREVPEDLEAILARCLEKEPHRRYDSAKALGEDLQRFLDGDAVRARRLSRAYLLLRKARKHRVAVALSGIALVALLIASALGLRARRLAAEQVSLARELGADVKEMELVLRTAYELPLHDVEREKDLVRARLHGIEARMAAAGKAGEGPGHYALGRGHLALQEPEAALSHLERASLAGYASPELDYALGIALGELYAKALVAATRIGNPAQRAAREQAIKEQYEVPALQHLRASLGARLETAAYAEGLLLLHEGKAEEAVAKAEEAFEQVPWLYEAKKLEGDARFAIGSRFRHDAAFEHDKMMGHFQAAAADYQRAAEIGRSDPRVHVAECELWAQVMNAASLRKDPLKPGFDRAKAACVRAITASPKSADARIKLGFVHVVFAWGLATGDPPLDPAQVLEEAIALGKEAMRWSPQEPMAPYVMGDAWRTEAFYRDDRGIDSSASIDQAVVSFEAAVRLDPTFVWPVQGLGNVYSMKARDDAYHGRDPVPSFEKALEYCRRGSELDPSHSPSRNAEIVTHLMLAEYLAAVGRDPGSSLSLARKGVAVLAELSPEWPWGDYFLAYAHWIEATHALDAGRDPTASLDLGAKVVAELARRSPASQDVHEMLGRLAVTRALHLLRRGKDPGPALGAARESFRKVAEGKPWDLGFQVWRARVESIGLRWASKAHELRAEPIRTARELLLPLLAEERVDPRLYQTMAEIDAIEAAWFQERGRSAEQAVAGGLAMADKALALNPHMAQALLARGALFLVRARAARAPQVRREAARSAEEALAAALRENPLLDGDVAPLLVEAKRARQSDGISEK